MLIHITPTFLTCERSGPRCELVDLRIEELGIYLRGGVDLATRRPFPNKNYLVGCRKKGRRADAGILIETNRQVRSYTVVSRWAVAAVTLLSHRVRYEVLDTEFGAMTDRMMLWGRLPREGGEWPSCWPTVHANASPATGQPRMELVVVGDRKGQIEDRVVNGLLMERNEIFPLPSIHPDRLYAFSHLKGDRTPVRESAFVAGAL